MSEHVYTDTPQTPASLERAAEGLELQPAVSPNGAAAGRVLLAFCT